MIYINTYFHPLITKELTLPWYVKCIGGFENQDSIIRPDGYPDYQWIHCNNGKGKLIIAEKEFNILPNTGIFIPANFPHSYYPLKEPFSTSFVAFNGYNVTKLMNSLDFNNCVIHHFNDIKLLNNLIYEIFTVSKLNNIQSTYKCSALLYTLIIEIKNSIMNNSNNIESLKFTKLQPVLNYIEKNYYNDISIEDMANSISISPQYLCRLFSEIYNMRPFTYLTKYRIQKAKELIINCPNETISSICLKVGYNSQSYFCFIFKKFEGITPLEYRTTFKF